MNALRFQSREDWLAARREGFAVGSSDVGKILGVAPASHGGPWSVWASHHAPELLDERTTARMAEGHLWERAVLQVYSQRRGVSVVAHDYTIALDRERPWMRASLDASVPGAGGLVEVKTWAGDRLVWGEDGTTIEAWSDDYAGREMPLYVAAQVYWQMAVTGAGWCDVAVALPRRDGMPEVRIIRVLRDEDLQADIVGQVKAWRERHLVNGEPPPRDASPASLRQLAAIDVSDTIRQATSAEEDLLARYAVLHAEHADVGSRLSDLKAQLGAACDDCRGIEGGAGRFLYTPTKGRRSLSLSKLEQERPDLAASLEAAGLITNGRPSRTARFYPRG